MTVLVQLIHGPGCPNLDAVRNLLRACLAQSGVAATIEEIEGLFPSPTLLVDGVDVTGRHASEASACRLDLPTERDIMTALTSGRARRQNATSSGRGPVAADPRS